MVVHPRRPFCQPGGRGLSGSPLLTKGKGPSGCSSKKQPGGRCHFPGVDLRVTNIPGSTAGGKLAPKKINRQAAAPDVNTTRTSRTSFHSVSFLQPSLHCLRKQRSLRLSSNKVCLRCWDSCTSRVLSWPHSLCCSRAWRPKLCTWKSRRNRAFWCSSCSYDVKDISEDFKKDSQPKVEQVIAFFLFMKYCLFWKKDTTRMLSHHAINIWHASVCSVHKIGLSCAASLLASS